MKYRPPLLIHLLFHPGSLQGRQLAESLVPKFLAAPACRGLRIPIFLVPANGDNLPPRFEPRQQFPHDPDWVDWESAEHTIVVIIADAHMNRRVDGGTGAQWAELTQRIIASHDRQRHAILLVSLDNQGTQLSPQQNFLTFKPDQDLSARVEETAFQISVRALRLLRGLPDGPTASQAVLPAPVTFFLSHAKADLDGERKGLVHRVLEEISTMKVDQWFDSRDIELSEEFKPKIEQGIRDSDLVIVFLTDSWAKSSWCRMEAACAKEVGTPVLVVDALKDGEPRNFPYGGNVRVIRWPVPDETMLKAVLGDMCIDEAMHARLQVFRLRAARMLLSSAVLETLTRAHNVRQVQLQTTPEEVSLDISPEAFHLATHADKGSFLYPDPPLTGEEYAVLRGLRPEALFETPLMRMSRMLRLEKPLTVAVSVSDSDVLVQYGLTPLHLRTITDEIHLYLLVAGLRIAYGGKLEPEKLNDPDNFTLRLFDLVSGYREFARTFGAEVKPILNVAPWPLWTTYDDNVLNKFGTIAELEKVPCPELGLSESELKPMANGFVVPNTIPHQYAWGLAMTAMREKMTGDSFARVVMGGKIEGYKGRYAGLIEEPLLSMRAIKPLYLIGSLGGCARLVIDLLEQRDRHEMTTATAYANVPGYDDLENFYAKQRRDFYKREELAAEIKAFGSKGPAAALHNGLNDDENRELFACIEPRRIAELILTGLSRVLNAQGMSHLKDGSTVGD